MDTILHTENHLCYLREPANGCHANVSHMMISKGIAGSQDSINYDVTIHSHWDIGTWKKELFVIKLSPFQLKSRAVPGRGFSKRKRGRQPEPWGRQSNILADLPKKPTQI